MGLILSLVAHLFTIYPGRGYSQDATRVLCMSGEGSLTW